MGTGATRGTAGYTVKQLADLSGTSVRTLHHYDRIGLLAPGRMDNGYRAYSPQDVDKLQSILLYRATGMPLADIKQVLEQPDADAHEQLARQRKRLEDKRLETEKLIETIDKTIACLEGTAEMNDAEKFEGLKKNLVEDNERVYGQEMRLNWGDRAIDASNEKVLKMTAGQYRSVKELEQQIREELRQAMYAGGPEGPQAQHVCDLHRQWISAFWENGSYTKEAHKGLGSMYVSDVRFEAYYEAIAPGAAQFLHEALDIYCTE
jgi:DNA-binding transcriptional MerR regulator